MSRKGPEGRLIIGGRLLMVRRGEPQMDGSGMGELLTNRKELISRKMDVDRI
ncbi:hypothetical protein KB559_24285 [Paenibacillus sp. Marseille-P2973]|uniref:hypothetical protein n=1 Tax=Paenibacillus sp. Marseille-P2973 TaxID=1871032 RepID=UPI001B35BE2B|nr:hypothetical protein [Paenibacillus sp. Marseille-P2973]MBQ4901935.1 hypothetical protein [Paenibacillus sp. Marseille-P2973]